mgnify:CR=1 FL=1
MNAETRVSKMPLGNSATIKITDRLAPLVEENYLCNSNDSRLPYFFGSLASSGRPWRSAR